jgi:predicted nucleic acid-binding protein
LAFLLDCFGGPRNDGSLALGIGNNQVELLFILSYRNKNAARLLMKIYMDVCCLSRPFDDLSQDRARLEAEAATNILERCRIGVWSLTASEVIDFELSAIKDKDKLLRIKRLYSLAENMLLLTDQAKTRSAALQGQGLALFDSLHLALAEIFQQDIFLTTDDKLIKKARTIIFDIKVANPVSWFLEVG